jgi:hypothetical protein
MVNVRKRHNSVFLEMLKLTSGVPFGRRNSSGTILFTLVFLSSEGGDGFALYSVREKLLRDGVLCGV